MAQQRLGIIMNGVTGRMGMNQHLIRSIVAIRDAGRRRAARTATASCPIRSWSAATPRSSQRSPRRTASRAGPPISTRRSTNKDDTLFFDAATTQMRADLLSRRRSTPASTSIARSRSPTTLADALDRRAAAPRQAGIKHGVVQDKLFLPGLRKLKMLIDSGFFGRMLSVRGEFGYWVFEGDLQPAQRPSWNYKKAEGGGIILDMLCHWRYVLDNLFGEVEACPASAPRTFPSAGTRTASPTRPMPTMPPTPPSSSKAASSRTSTRSWCTRVRRDDLVTFQVDGTHGSAVAGLAEVLDASRA